MVVPLVTCVVCFVSSEYRLHAVAPLLLWSKHTTSPLLRTNSNSRAAYQNYVLAYAKLGENDRVADMLRRSRASEKR